MAETDAPPGIRKIAEGILAETGAALMTRDFRRFRPHFCLPHQIVTDAERSVIGTEDEMLCVFDKVCDHYEQAGIENMVRVILDVWHGAEGWIALTHETHLLKQGFWAEAPFTVFSIIARRGTAWQVESSNYALPSTTRHGRALHSNTTTIRTFSHDTETS